MKLVRILLAEDSRGDIALVREALKQYEIAHQLHVAVNGEEALAFIAIMGQPDQPPCPDIFLLDLNLPRIDGWEVLREFRRHPACSTTPVIIMSSSDTPRDLEAADALDVTSYFAKPMIYEAFMEIGQLIKDAVYEK